MSTLQRPRPARQALPPASIAQELQLIFGSLLGELTVRAVIARHIASGTDPRDLFEDCRAELAEIIATF